MKAVAFTELIIFLRVVLGAVTFQNSLLSPLIYAHFLRQRYYQSAFTRDVVGSTTARVDNFIQRQNNPTLTNVWVKAKGLVGRWAGSSLAPNQTAGPAR